LLRWQYRWWLARADAAAARADAAGVQRNLSAAVRLLPKARLSRALEIWLACAYGGVRPPREAVGRAMDGLAGRPVDAGGAALLRLSVWMCERFGTPAEVVGHLNRLLELAPGDQWGLERWKRWMMRLARRRWPRGACGRPCCSLSACSCAVPTTPTAGGGAGASTRSWATRTGPPTAWGRPSAWTAWQGGKAAPGEGSMRAPGRRRPWRTGRRRPRRTGRRPAGTPGSRSTGCS